MKTEPENEKDNLFDHIMFMGIPMIVKKRHKKVIVDVRSPEEAKKFGMDTEMAERVFAAGPGRSCHMEYSRWKWSGFSCDDDTCANPKQCLLHSWDKATQSWKPCPTPGTNQNAVYACFCV